MNDLKRYNSIEKSLKERLTTVPHFQVISIKCSLVLTNGQN